MSDIQDPLIVLQQRQILAMMGINQWVQPSSKTLSIAGISAPALLEQTTANPILANPSISSAITTEQPSIESSNIESPNINAISDMVDDESINHYYNDANDTDLSYSDQQSPVTYSFDSTTPNALNISKPAVTSFVDTVVQQASITDINKASSFENGSFKAEGFQEESFKKVAPFDLQGGRYGDWVILVDIQALNHDSQKLWQNITQALSISCETTSFPICEGMDTAELANASLAGYVFKIGRSEEIQVVTLTALPEGLEHPNLTTAPTLDEMLTDSNLKRQLWEQLSSQS
ncbi:MULTISPECIES: hypothetical protein [unclassified Psychrobacter]|uniref:hypothetical protein n=1 Tax=unclassified Psychrobacter TaxID=196806 RepID=UPI000EBB2A45|nr:MULTISPECIES: hypothetical protein [unclassified Psychrobacter]MBE8608832.1 hypothetical protein [Pseudomonas lundensis]HCI77031.1 hypothetical protein [Psychrobacter sp.]